MFWRLRRRDPAKGVGLVIPTLLAWDESAVIYDIKGENWAKTAGFRASRGQLCFKFSPVEEATSSRFNPLAEVRLFTPRDVSDAQNIADMIIRSGEDSPMERHWEDTAASLTTGMILHACYTAAAEDRVACLADLAGHLHAARRRIPRNPERDAQLSARHRVPARVADTQRPQNLDPSCRLGKSAGDARQGEQGIVRRPVDRENGAGAL